MDLTPAFFLQHQDLLIVLLVGILLGIVLGLVIRNGKIRVLEHKNAELELTLQLEQKNKQQLDEILDHTRDQLANTFNQLSNEALTRNNSNFLRLAEENLKRFQSEAKADLGTKEKAIEQMLKPINEALQQTTKQIQEIEKDRKEAYGSLNTTIAQMNLNQQQLQLETQNLVQALRRPEVRGQWGEMTLRRLAELSGMVSHCDFYEQTHTTTETGSIRPDMIVRLPEKREIIVDAKTPLDAYLSAIQAKDDATRKLELKRHAQIIRGRIKELSRKNYWAEYSQSPEFVVLFIPGEQFLSAALEVDPALLEDSMSQNIILATPTNFIALLRAVSYGWKQQALAENAEIIRELGETLYKRLSTFGNHLSKLGNSLGSSVNHFNSAVGSLERQVLPGARKFTEMGISSKNAITDLPPVEQMPRQVQNLSDEE
ncbi:MULTISPECIES: DNA recombination protein RmuC [unclassified Methylophaga]|jgi:DNA recombination protein RmuC|uniref:DNA recombination protein RmuC n=1 Tax=unclassified Methylophaga TaxID=2629249 RepID=UPI000C95C5B3|nr:MULTISPECIES: DNA recombination protein RmuC [unclassified Methylophaga]MAK66889.1 DNA recombination protein RmuC [Methylophaga sp.]MAY17925.1 DNA recombination protein RmuC [Methylophaga sp.]MBN47135.1 DNA recombination protein RmuC [Methylophaga sp.]HCD05516.1 DNA recombination protein RmuC [Methylophaga sp.]|tara:strand:+ start:24222 stop:25508 length:1287 start_codon:yes stop_codon:yes gene_type:complete